MFSLVIVVMYSILNLPVILYSGAVVFRADLRHLRHLRHQQVHGSCHPVPRHRHHRRLLRHLRRPEGSCGFRYHQRHRPYHRRSDDPVPRAARLLGHADHRRPRSWWKVSSTSYKPNPAKSSTQWASWDAAGTGSLPWPLIFTGMFFNNLYWWCTNQSFVQRALAAKSLKEGQKGAILLRLPQVPSALCYLVLPGVIALPPAVHSGQAGCCRFLRDRLCLPGSDR